MSTPISTSTNQDNSLSPYLDNKRIALKHLSADAHINAMNGFKLPIERCNYLYSLIKSNSAEIIAAGRYDTVLEPIIKKKYIDSDNYFWITESIKAETEKNNAMYYFTWEKWAAWNNKTFSEIENDKFGPYKDLVSGYTKDIDYVKNITVSETTHLIRSYIERWDNHVQLCYKIYIPDLLDPTKLIQIGSSINLSDYLSPDLKNDPARVPIEFYKYLFTINDVIDAARNGATQFTSTNIVTSDLMKKWSTDRSVFEYNADGTIENTKCLYSETHPEFAGKAISDCVIAGSAKNYPEFIGRMMNDLNDSYRNLSEGQVVKLVFRGTDNRTYIAIVFVITYNGATAWVYQTIDFGLFIRDAMDVSGDVTIKGTLNVQTFDKQDIVCIDNKSKIMTVFNKVGINQEASQVQGLLDIDNLSMNKLLSVLAEFDVVQKESFYALQAMISDNSFHIDNNDLTNKSLPVTVTPVSGSGAQVVLRAPLKNIISTTDLVKVGTHSSAQLTFLAKTDVGAAAILHPSSFSKVLIIINEMNKMRSEILGYKTNKDANTVHVSSESDMIYTFVEILNDTDFHYLCSMRAIIKEHSTTISNDGTSVTTFDDYIYFVISTLDITNIMIDKSYSSDMEKIVKKISGANKYLNLSVLVAHQPHIHNKLFTNSGKVDTSQNWVQEYIKSHEHFYDNFDVENSELYSFCGVLTGSENTIINNFTSSYDETIDYSTVIFHGENPLLVNKKTKDIYLEGTDLNINEPTFIATSQTLKQYGLIMGAQHHVIYTWVKNKKKIKKLSAVCMYRIRNRYYRFGCGFDLENEIDNSITLKGDSSFGGDITVRNANNDIIYKIDNVNETISNIYNVSIGKEVPTTKLDVKDSATNDLVILIKELGRRINNMNFNKITIKTSTDDSISTTIEEDLTEANVPGNTQYTNTDKDYYTLLTLIQDPPAPTNDDWGFVTDDFILEYNYLLRQYWITYFGHPMSAVNNAQTTDAKKFALNNIKQIVQTTFLFDNSFNIDIVTWIQGKKVVLGQTYKTQSTGEYHQIRTGLDLQDYGLQFFSNANISNFFNVLKYFQNYLSVMVANLNNIPLTSPRYTLPFDELNVNLRKYGKPDVFKIKLYTTTQNNQHLKSVVYNLSNNYTPSPTSTLNKDNNDASIDNSPASFTPDYAMGDENSRQPGDVYNYTDNNIMMKYQSLILNIFSTYKTDLNMQCFDIGDYGLVTYEDRYKYFMGYIYCMNEGGSIGPDPDNADITIDTRYVELLVLEKPLTDIALPAVLLGGDTEVSGEFVVADKSNYATGEIKNYTVIDPHNKFMGVNTDERDIFYTYKFNTITNSNTIKQNLYVKNDKYPVAVFERLWESELVDHAGIAYIDNGDGTTSLDPTYTDQFASFSALTAKRYSDYYKFQELYDYANIQNRRYGVDIAFEMRNLYMESQEIGHVGMVIDKTNDQVNAETFDTTIQAGFLVTATEITTLGSSEKELLYVSNSGDLSVNSIILPQRTDTSNMDEPVKGLPVSPTVGQMVFIAIGEELEQEHYLYVCVKVVRMDPPTAGNTVTATWKRVLLSALP
jgi:hypothetical protein